MRTSEKAPPHCHTVQPPTIRCCCADGHSKLKPLLVAAGADPRRRQAATLSNCRKPLRAGDYQVAVETHAMATLIASGKVKTSPDWAICSQALKEQPPSLANFFWPERGPHPLRAVQRLNVSGEVFLLCAETFSVHTRLS